MSWLIPAARPNFAPHRRRPRPRLAVEPLDDRRVPAAAPVPIPGGFANPAGGAFVHLNLPGPADAPPPNPPTSPAREIPRAKPSWLLAGPGRNWQSARRSA